MAKYVNALPGGEVVGEILQRRLDAGSVTVVLSCNPSTCLTEADARVLLQEQLAAVEQFAEIMRETLATEAPTQ